MFRKVVPSEPTGEKLILLLTAQLCTGMEQVTLAVRDGDSETFSELAC